MTIRRTIQRLLKEQLDPDGRHIELSNADVSHPGSRVSRKILQPGQHIGIRGPKHNGYHAIDTVNGDMVTMKCEDGHMVTIPIKDLDDHEVVHATHDL